MDAENVSVYGYSAWGEERLMKWGSGYCIFGKEPDRVKCGNLVGILSQTCIVFILTVFYFWYSFYNFLHMYIICLVQKTQRKTGKF